MQQANGEPTQQQINNKNNRSIHCLCLCFGLPIEMGFSETKRKEVARTSAENDETIHAKYRTRLRI